MRLDPGRNRLIAICTKDPSQLIMAAIACWRVGCAYLPIDPSWPIERIKYVLNEADPALMTFDSSAERLAAELGDRGVPTYKLDHSETPDNYFVAKAAAPGHPIEADDLAYVICTSGSTGRPKGVAVTQGNLHNLIEWYKVAFSITNSDRTTQTGALTFDASVGEIWPALSVGATVHILDQSIFLNPEKLRDYIVSHRITLCQLATAPAEQLLTVEWPQDIALRCLYTGGDRLCAFSPAGLPFQFLNLYGPTECTVYATAGVVPPDAAPGSLPSIGHPLLNTEVLILDPELNEVPRGEQGEIFIGGASVAAGYIGRPDLTAEKFIAHPSRSGTSRLYRTGDIGRVLPDGAIEYCGRTDDQVKLLGWRIEPAEILAALRSEPAVSAAAVMLHGEGGNKRLTAYVVLAREVSAAELRAHIATQLPAFMVPSCFVRLDALPLTGNGKIDRAALPYPEPSILMDRPALAGAPPDTKSQTERELMDIWAQLLGVRNFSPSDDFFEVGGNSLLAVRLFRKIQQRFGVEFRPSLILEISTLRELSSAIEGKVRDREADSPLIRLNGSRSGTPLFLVHPVGGDVVTYRTLASYISDCPVYGLQAPRRSSGTHESVETMAAGYIRVLASVQPRGPYHLGGYSAGGLIAVEMQRQLTHMGESVGLLALIEPVIQTSVHAAKKQEPATIVLRLVRWTVASNVRTLMRVGLREYLKTKSGRSLGSEFLASFNARMYLGLMKRNSASRKWLSWKPSLSSRESIELASLNYKPEPVSGSALYFRSEGFMREHGDPTAAWEGIFSDGLQIVDIPGEHYMMMQDAQAAELARHLSAAISRARSESADPSPDVPSNAVAPDIRMSLRSDKNTLRV